MTEEGFDGAAFRAARIKAGLSQRDLASAAAVSRTTLKYIEAGTRQPHWATAERIARALGVALDQLAAPRRTPAPRDAA